jgi:hypothetical protein
MRGDPDVASTTNAGRPRKVDAWPATDPGSFAGFGGTTGPKENVNGADGTKAAAEGRSNDPSILGSGLSPCFGESDATAWAILAD